jgi:hypothetical protein
LSPGLKKRATAVAASAAQRTFLDFNGTRLHAIHQTIGDPVGTQCGVDQLKNLVVVTENSELSLSAFFSQLIEASEVTGKGIITIFNYHSSYQ